MTHARHLNWKEKIILSSLGYNPSEFLKLKRTPEGYEFIQVRTEKILSIRG